MDITEKNIGIWGLGVAGRAVLNYLITRSCSITILNTTPLNPELSALCKANNVTFFLDTPENRDVFLTTSNLIIPSPGIDLGPYSNYASKFLPEADLFYQIWKKPIIGITGTLGKTSITHLLTTLLNNSGISAVAGGNIGIGMLETVTSKADYAVLELSSFQLEQCKTFAPDCAVWTNFYPNHLDRHETMDAYYQAKKNIFFNQTTNQVSLVPIELAEPLQSDPKLAGKQFAFFCKNKPTQQTDTAFYFDRNGNIVKNNQIILSKIAIPKISYKTNWLIIAATLDLLGLDAQQVIEQTKNFTLPSYRLEHVATIRGVKYYNDSKSTIMQATVAAVNEIQNGPIILLLGGTSKSVDRTKYIKQLVGKVSQVICFGGEAASLNTICKNFGLHSQASPTLETALQIAGKAKAGTSVLLSPGGASFDLFKNYQARGERFKNLISTL